MRDVAARHWDAMLPGFSRSAASSIYVRKVADGRQRIHLDFLVRPPHAPLSFHLVPRCTIAFPRMATLCAEMLGQRPDRAGTVDAEFLDEIYRATPTLLFSSPEELGALADEAGRRLIAELVTYLDERMSIAALTEANERALTEWEEPGRVAVARIAAGRIAMGDEPGGRRFLAEHPDPVTLVDPRLVARRGTFRLRSAASVSATVGPGPDDIGRVVGRLGTDNFFALLETADDAHYAQVGYGPRAGAEPGVYALEYREGSADRHFRTETRDVVEAKRFLCEYLDGEELWRRRHVWQVYPL